MNGSGRHTRKNLARLNLDSQAKVTAVRSLDLRAALEFYGVEFDRRGFARCPFHREKTASFKIHNNKYKCFGCGATGDLIDFVSASNKLGFSAAVNAICRDFKIEATPTIADIEKCDELRLQKSRNKKEYRQLLLKKSELHELVIAASELVEAASKLPGGKWTSNELYVSAHFALMQANALLTEAEHDCIDYAAEHPDALTVSPQAMEFPAKLEWTGLRQAKLPFKLQQHN